MSLAWTLYRWLAPGLGALAPWAGVFTSPAERQVWDERMGVAPVMDGCHAWVHAASLGEAVAVGPFVGELLALQPRARLLLTATTRTGRDRLRELGHPAALAPIDSPQAARRRFDRVRPRRLFLVETEIWPHWLLRARDDRVPVAIVSARISERSAANYRRLGPELRTLVAGLGGVLCQTEEDASRWRGLGAPPERTVVVGNLKHDALPAGESDRRAARSRVGLDRERPVLVLGSLRPGEARRLALAWRAIPAATRGTWQVVAVPRHAHATGELQAEASHAGVGQAAGGAPTGDAWRWDARPGVLRDYYAAAEVAFVGGSLEPLGGHNPMEPAACGCAVVMGSHYRSQLQSVRALRDTGGIEIARDGAELAAALRRLVLEPALRAAQADRARGVVRELRGGARRAVAYLTGWGLWPAE